MFYGSVEVNVYAKVVFPVRDKHTNSETSKQISVKSLPANIKIAASWLLKF